VGVARSLLVEGGRRLRWQERQDEELFVIRGRRRAERPAIGVVLAGDWVT
jgi:hypothetical protein